MKDFAAVPLAQLLETLQREADYFDDRIEVAYSIICDRLTQAGESHSDFEQNKTKEFRQAVEEIRAALRHCNSNFRVSELCAKFHDFYATSVRFSKTCRCYFYVYHHNQTDENKLAIEKELIAEGLGSFRYFRWDDMKLEPSIYPSIDDDDPLFQDGSPVFFLASALNQLYIYRDSLLEDEAKFEAARDLNPFGLPENVEDFDVRQAFELAKKNGYCGKLRQLRQHLATWKGDERATGEKWLLSRAELSEFLRYLSERQRAKP